MSHWKNKKSYTSSLVTISSEYKLYISVLNFVDNLVTLPKKTNIRSSHFSPYVQAKILFPVDPSFLSVAEKKVSEVVETKINQLIQNTIANSERQLKKTLPNTKNCSSHCHKFVQQLIVKQKETSTFLTTIKNTEKNL